jgi:hypothetical protein
MHSNGLHYQCCGSVFTSNSRGLYGAYMQAIRSGHPRWIKWGERGRLERGWGEGIVGRWARNLQIIHIRLCFSTFSICFCLTLLYWLKSVLRIHDILVWIRIRIHGSMPLIFKKKLFCLLLFEGTFTSFFKDKKSKSSYKRVGIKVFHTIFAWWLKDPDSDPDPDPHHWLKQ